MTLLDGPTKEDWFDFYTSVIEPSGAAGSSPDPADAYRPGCNDLPVDGQPGTPTIISRFWSPLEVQEFFPFVNPLSWATLGSAYWREMRPVTPLATTSRGFSGTFREVVAMPLGDITAYLDVEYWNDGVNTAFCTFRESPLVPSDVTFDRGFVMATNLSGSPVDGARTMVQSNKSIVFRDALLNELPELACDNGWCDLMIRMAIPPGRDRPTPGTATLGAATTSGDDIERWQAEVKGFVERCGARSQRAMQDARAGRWNDGVVDAVIGGFTDLTELATPTVRAWRQAVRSLSSSSKDGR